MGRSVAIDPERGPLLAAGAIALATAIAMVNARLESAWGHGVQFVVAALAFGLIWWIVMRAPLADAAPWYLTALGLSALALLAIVLLRLAQVLGAAHPLNAGTLLWTLPIFAAAAAFLALRFASVPCAFLAGLAVAGFILAFVQKVFSPDGISTFRWILLLLGIGFAAAAVNLRRGPRAGWSVQSVSLAGYMLIALSTTFLVTAIVAAASFGGADGAAEVQAGFGWRVVVVAGSLALLGYAAATRQRGPGWVGLVSLLLAITIVANRSAGETIMGWPIVLLLAAGALLALGLMPRPPGTTSSRRPARPPRPARPGPPPA